MVRVVAVAASILLVLGVGLIWQMVPEPGKPARNGEVIARLERTVMRAGTAAQMLAVADLLSKQPAARDYARERYRQIITERFKKGARIMKILKKSQLLVVLLVASSLAFGAAEEPNSEKGELKFTISDEPGEWDASLEQSMQIAKPTHVAVFQLENLRNWGPPWVSWITIVKGESKQKLERVAFTGEGSLTKPCEFLLSMDRTGKNRWQFWVYAASEQEARQMAELLIGYAKDLAYARVRRDEALLENYRKRLTDAENEIPKLEEQKKPLEAELAKIKKTTYYRNKDDAQKSMLGWNNLLSAVEVDIIGIQAKLDMINQLKQKQSKTEEVDGMTFVSGGEALWSLRKMQMAEEVELAGALARKNAALSYRDKAVKFLDLAEKLDSLSTQLERKRVVLGDNQATVASIERRLPQERANVRLVEVVNNEAKIHPVETVTPKLPRYYKKKR
jgi:hypothetical protein